LGGGDIKDDWTIRHCFELFIINTLAMSNTIYIGGCGPKIRPPKFFIHPCARYKQLQKMAQLQIVGFQFDYGLTCSYAAVVLRHKTALWIFGLDGSIGQDTTN